MKINFRTTETNRANIKLFKNFIRFIEKTYGRPFPTTSIEILQYIIDVEILKVLMLNA